MLWSWLIDAVENSGAYRFKVKPGHKEGFPRFLVRDDVIPSLAPEPDRNLFPEGSKAPWIKPGRSTWTWWDRGNVLENDQYAFVDMTAEFGWEYHLVDEGWKKWGRSLPESMDKLAKLASYAAGKNVGIWVWVRWSDVNNPANDWENMRRFFSSLSKTGIRGIKIDFMDSASQERLDFYDAVAENLAKNKLMVNFHGANTPTGEERSWPHEMSREGIYGGRHWRAALLRAALYPPSLRPRRFHGRLLWPRPQAARFFLDPPNGGQYHLHVPHASLGLQPRGHGSCFPEGFP